MQPGENCATYLRKCQSHTLRACRAPISTRDGHAHRGLTDGAIATRRMRVARPLGARGYAPSHSAVRHRKWPMRGPTIFFV